MKKILVAVAAVVVVAAVAVGGWLVLGGDDEASVRGTCGGATYELGREEDDGALEVTFELQSAGAGEVWDVTVAQGGTTILTGERTTDDDGELDVDAPADRSAGTGFTVEAVPAAGGEPCTASVD